jgi:hypothetical protein
MRIGSATGESIVFLAAHPEVGDIEVQDDGDELTVTLGRFTHSHFANHDEGITDSERADRIVDDLVLLLEDVFADRIEFFGSHETGGGFRMRCGRRDTLEANKKLYVWSGPLTNNG